MKPRSVLLPFLLLLAAGLRAAAPTPVAPLASGVIHWDKIALAPTPTGARTTVFDAPTPTLDKFHCHVSTLNPGQNTGAPHRHPQEELVILKAGTLEVNINGKIETAETGSLIFYAANELENMRNPGTVPATYYVLQFFTPATPKS
jgi:XRE family transcriptional regulator, regulator of sulfur utilization